jgi:hypothetical protein
MLRIVGAVDILLVLVCTWFWKPVWRRVPKVGELTFPNLEGVWRGELRYQTALDQPARSKTVVARIKQSLMHLDMTLASDMSESKTLAMHLDRNAQSGQQQMFYTYASDPWSPVLPATAHKGAATLTVRHGGTVLQGTYFNDQARRGELELNFVSGDMEDYDHEVDAIRNPQ